MISSLQKDNVYVGFVDGSWKINNDGQKIGIVGFILDQQGIVKYIFPGAVKNCTGWELELLALYFPCKALQEKVRIDIPYTVSMDSKLFYDLVQKSKAFPLQLDKDNEYLYHITNMTNTKVVLIQGTQSGEADQLAKEGVVRSKMLSGWI